jgi:ankyrin repeat protein
MPTRNQSEKTRQQMKRLYEDLDDIRRPLIRQGVDNFANKVEMTNENRQKLHEMVDIVSAADFKSAIQRCIDWFLRRFADFKARTGRPPAFAIGRFFEGERAKSSDWLEHKLIEALGFPLFYVVDTEKIQGPVDFVVLLDDALYSGSQVEEWVQRFNRRRYFHTPSPALLIATGYATVEGARRVRSALTTADELFFAKTMQSNASRSGHTKQAIKALMNKYDFVQIGPLTFMPHKTANFVSIKFHSHDHDLANAIRYQTGTDGIYGKINYNPYLGKSLNKIDARSSVDGQTPLTKAAVDGNMDRVRALIFNRHANVNRTNEFGETALMIASYRGDVDMVRLLVKAGADVNFVKQGESDEETALMIASAQGHLGVVRTLVEAGAVVDQRTQESDETALMMAADRGHLDVFRFLLSRGANPNKKSFFLKNAWSYAENSAHDAILRLRRSTTGRRHLGFAA